MYEHHKERLLSRTGFLRRLARHFAVAVLVVAVSLFVGMAGYVHFEGLGWLDAFLNAAMLLGGMGPIWSPATPGGKLFAGLYALYAGMVFLVVASIILGPAGAPRSSSVPLGEERRMNINLLLGVAAILYGLYTAFVRARTPEKFAKLDAMRKQWGERAGTAVHTIGYTVVPIVVGVVLVVSALRHR